MAPFVIYRKKRDNMDDKKVPEYLTEKICVVLELMTTFVMS